MQDIRHETRRVILKIGTSVLLDSSKRISTAKTESFARQIKAVTDMGIGVIVVSSGAIACGMETMGLSRKPKEVSKKQALAIIKKGAGTQFDPAIVEVFLKLLQKEKKKKNKKK